MKVVVSVISAVALTVLAFMAGLIFALKELPEAFPEPPVVTVDPVAATFLQFGQLLTEFEADELYGARSEHLLRIPTPLSHRPVLFRGRIVPLAAVTLFEENEQLKADQALIADGSLAAEEIDYWIAKIAPSKFWERRAERIAGWVQPPPSAQADEKPSVGEETSELTDTPPPPVEAPPSAELLKELAEAEGEYVKMAGETPEKLATLPPAESLRPVIFREQIVPQAAQVRYEDNERLKLLGSPSADYRAEAEEPVLWVPRMQTSAFWNHRLETPVYKAQVAAASNRAAAGNEVRLTAASNGTAVKPLPGRTGYMTKQDAMGKLGTMAGERGALEQERRTVMDRRTALIGEQLKAKSEEFALNADWKSHATDRQRLLKLGEEFRRDAIANDWRLNKEESLWHWDDTGDPENQALRRRLLAKNSEWDKYNDRDDILSKRQKDLDEKLKKIAEEEEQLKAKAAGLTEKINAIIKDQTAVQAMLPGNKR